MNLIVSGFLVTVLAIVVISGGPSGLNRRGGPVGRPGSRPGGGHPGGWKGPVYRHKVTVTKKFFFRHSRNRHIIDQP